MRWLPRARVIRVLLGLIGLVAVGLAVVWQIAGSSEPVTDKQALATFKAASSGTIPAGGPAPGVYRYTAMGTERGGAGPLAITRDVPSAARLVVTPQGRGWEAELAYSRQHIESARYEPRDGAIVITWRRTEVTFAGFGRDDRRLVDPPSVFLPAQAAPGATWSETYRTGDITVRSRNRIERSESVIVDGASVGALVVVSDSTTTGAHPGRRTDTLWWAPALGLPVRWDVDMDIGGVFAFRARTRLVLVSAIAAT